MKEYVLCFVPLGNLQALYIEKMSPVWQKGLFNWPGGKIESGESPEQAARRELYEESGLTSTQETLCGILEGPGYRVYVIHCRVLHQDLVQKTSERVFWMPHAAMNQEPRVINNIRIMLPLIRQIVLGWTLRQIELGDLVNWNLELPCVSQPT